MTSQVNKSKKSVTFADGVKHTTHIYEARATDVLWEFPEFFPKCRQAAHKAGKRLRQDGHDALLEDCFGTTTGNDVQKRLNEFVRQCDDGRGVERFISKSMFTARKEERSKAINAILICQTQAKQQGRSPDELAERLREVSLVFCLNAKVFARRMGKADAAACYKKSISSSNSSTNSLKCTSTQSLPALGQIKVKPSNLPARMA
jgi:hypothetical protein